MLSPRTHATLTALQGGRVLRDGTWDDAPLFISEGRLADTGEHGRWLDASGCVVVPGIVDFHGDAFERQIMPRPQVSFPLPVAMLDTDRQLAANGITTALHGVTHSWEGGLRGADTLHRLLPALKSVRTRCLVDHRLHLRFECHHVDGEAQTIEWLRAGHITLLAFNDHLPGMLRKPHKWKEWADRAHTDVAGFEALVRAAAERADEVPALTARLAGVARDHGVPMASHDDPSIEVRRRYGALGCHISEFPLTRDVAQFARSEGAPVVCGAPNVLRGGSHVGAPRAADLAADGLCTILASDYYYPAPLHAACKLVAEALLPLERAWALVSANPADALGLSDRGRIASGLRADLLVVDVRDLSAPQLVATVSNGRLVHLADASRLHV